MQTFTIEQAIAIREYSQRLIGTPMDDEITITNIWIVPVDQDFEIIARKYQYEMATSESIARTYGNGENLTVRVFSSDLLSNDMPIFPYQDVVKYLTSEEIDKVLTGLN